MRDFLSTALAGVTFTYVGHTTMPGYNIGATTGIFSGMPDTLRATQDVNGTTSYLLDFRMRFNTPTTSPLCIENLVRLWANDPCGDSLGNANNNTLYPLGYIESRHSKVEWVAIPPAGNVEKISNLHGNRVGCDGTFTITIHGPQPANYRYYDIMPPCVRINSITTDSGCSMTPLTTLPTRYLITGPALANGAQHVYSVDYTVFDGSCWGQLHNQIFTDSLGLDTLKAETWNWLMQGPAQPCIQKTVCSNDSVIGGLVRFRIRI